MFVSSLIISGTVRKIFVTIFLYKFFLYFFSFDLNYVILNLLPDFLISIFSFIVTQSSNY